MCMFYICFFFFFQAEDGIRDRNVTGVQTCALPIFLGTHEETLQHHALGDPAVGVAIGRVVVEDDEVGDAVVGELLGGHHTCTSSRASVGAAASMASLGTSLRRVSIALDFHSTRSSTSEQPRAALRC